MTKDIHASNEASGEMTDSDRLSGLLRMLDQRHHGNDISIDDILKTFASRGFGPMLVVPALLALICPIPGIPTACGLFMALVAIQQLFGRDYPWLPRRLRRVSIGEQRFHNAVERIAPRTDSVERLLKPRLTFVDSGLARRVIALLVVLLSLSMAPLELLPFAAALPAGMLLLIALGMIARDGLVILIGVVVATMGVGWLLTMLL
ncbi:exopolysaccharide biosynthesis protein [Kushneria aurantia]|uniref:Exopolysaccharide biosynthesis protein n=1 Tax=Kushneria aurantia TaxID=504092 RepID=A0ABV6G790_9GAMM|nr:exopolysaccharide biosynthesis protein [Kushneria aurantia]